MSGEIIKQRWEEEIQESDYTYVIKHKPLFKCECGREFELFGDSMGEVGCDCGRVYNIFGQELKGFTQPFTGMNEWGEYY